MQYDRVILVSSKITSGTCEKVSPSPAPHRASKATRPRLSIKGERIFCKQCMNAASLPVSSLSNVKSPTRNEVLDGQLLRQKPFTSMPSNALPLNVSQDISKQFEPLLKLTDFARSPKKHLQTISNRNQSRRLVNLCLALPPPKKKTSLRTSARHRKTWGPGDGLALTRGLGHRKVLLSSGLKLSRSGNPPKQSKTEDVWTNLWKFGGLHAKRDAQSKNPKGLQTHPIDKLKGRRCANLRLEMA